MKYSEALSWLYSTQQHGIKLGLENIQLLLDHLPTPTSKIIHVAGTNGKGSVCATIDSIARAQGWKCGLYTSPHLVNFRERIRIQGQMISEKEVMAGLKEIRQIIESLAIEPTFFEIATALALAYFARADLDLVILETGMGGRLDATNALRASVSVITPISMDHQQWLGPTLSAIASEKAGIIKNGVPVVSAPQAKSAERVLRETAQLKQTTIDFVFSYLEGFKLGLAGSHQKNNAAVSLDALRKAGLPPSDNAIKVGLASVEWPGRFQSVADRFILDGAHNQAATDRLAQTWAETHGAFKPTIIFGALADKDLRAICKSLLSFAGNFIVVPVKNPRSAQPKQIHMLLASLGAQSKVVANLEEALQVVNDNPGPVLVTGSLFLVGETLSLLEPSKGCPEVSSQ